MISASLFSFRLDHSLEEHGITVRPCEKRNLLECVIQV